MKKTDQTKNNLEDYFRIRFENKIALRPRREDCDLAPTTRLLAKKKEVEETEHELAKCKEWYKMKMAEIAAEREKLSDHENALKQEMLKYDPFFRENDMKRHRGEQKTKEERERQAKKDTEIKELRDYLKRLEDRKAEMQKAVSDNTKFRDFLLRAVSADTDYEEITDLLSRCDVLWATRRELLDREQRDAQTIDRETLKLLTSAEHLNTDVLRLNNQISDIHQRFERAQSHTVAWENTWTRIKNTAAKQTLQLGQVKMAIHNLYQLCMRYHRQRVLEHEEVVERTEPGQQIAEVERVMQDIWAVYRECCRRARPSVVQESGKEGNAV